MDRHHDVDHVSRGSLASDFNISESRDQENFIIGVVNEAETPSSCNSTLINVQTGKRDNFFLLVKNIAGFLVGRIVIIDMADGSIFWIEDKKIIFKILIPIGSSEIYFVDNQSFIECPECRAKIKMKNINKHLRDKHGFSSI